MKHLDVVHSIIEQVSSVILGKEKQILLLLTCLFAKGHLLIEDMPGTGKTTLVKALARSLDLEFKRVQCTNDLLPGDILGSYVFDVKKREFYFNPGPVFSNILLVDEINRATPKTQSGLLEAMAETQVTLEGHTHILPTPFFVVATQNPMEQSGTYPLPDSQLDRFMFKITLGYPSKDIEKILLKSEDRENLLTRLKPVTHIKEILKIQDEVKGVFVSDPIIEYIGELVEATRKSNLFSCGLSTRASFMLLNSSRTWAYIHGREYVLPEDVKEMMFWIGIHRLRSAQVELSTSELIKKLLSSIVVP